jgi:hypothetical protein
MQTLIANSIKNLINIIEMRCKILKKIFIYYIKMFRDKLIEKRKNNPYSRIRFLGKLDSTNDINIKINNQTFPLTNTDYLTFKPGIYKIVVIFKDNPLFNVDIELEPYLRHTLIIDVIHKKIIKIINDHFTSFNHTAFRVVNASSFQFIDVFIENNKIANQISQHCVSNVQEIIVPTYNTEIIVQNCENTETLVQNPTAIIPILEKRRTFTIIIWDGNSDQNVRVVVIKDEPYPVQNTN